MLAQSGLKDSIEKLRKIMKDGPRPTTNEYGQDNVDLDAAKTLAKVSLDALKLCKANVRQDSGGDPPVNPDLFDLQGVYGYWKLKDPNQI